MSPANVLQGTLDLLVLKTLDTLGAMHGYGIAQRIRRVSNEALMLNQGTLYPALVRLEDRGWIRATWQITEHNRRAKLYRLTPAGRRQLAIETDDWRRMSALVELVLAAEE